MPALVESMFSANRVVPWHGLGTVVNDAPDSYDALRLAGLDWKVISTPIYTNGNKIDNYVANVRDSDGSVLGVVSNKYDIVQNRDAFDFTDSLINTGNVRYETAGSLKGGKTVWLLAKLPSVSILGDDVDQYLVFMNSHDGKGAVKVFCTPVRVVCNNTLSMALNKASRCWSFKHMGNIELKLEEARMTLSRAENYIKALSSEADILANTSITNDKVNNIIEMLFPITGDMTDRQIKSAEYNRDALVKCYNADDIKKFQNTQWGLVNALSDFVSHTDPIRMTNTFKERRFESVVTGHPIFDRGVELIKTA